MKPLITAVDVAPASEQDGPQAKHLIDAQPAGRRPGRLLGDTAYGTGPVRAELAERDVDVLAPLVEGSVKPGRLCKRDFHIDLQAGTVTCPAGHTAAIRTEPSGQRRASFAKALCDACPLRERCVAPARGTRQLLIAPDEELLIAARQALDDPESADPFRLVSVAEFAPHGRRESPQQIEQRRAVPAKQRTRQHERRSTGFGEGRGSEAFRGATSFVFMRLVEHQEVPESGHPVPNVVGQRHPSWSPRASPRKTISSPIGAAATAPVMARNRSSPRWRSKTWVWSNISTQERGATSWATNCSGMTAAK